MNNKQQRRRRRPIPTIITESNTWWTYYVFQALLHFMALNVWINLLQSFKIHHLPSWPYKQMKDPNYSRSRSAQKQTVSNMGVATPVTILWLKRKHKHKYSLKCIKILYGWLEHTLNVDICLYKMTLFHFYRVSIKWKGGRKRMNNLNFFMCIWTTLMLSLTHWSSFAQKNPLVRCW